MFSGLKAKLSAAVAVALMGTVPTEITASDGAGAGIPGDTPDRKLNHHPFLHPTKGWRNFARPRKTNRRRKLIRQGALSVKGSHANNLLLREWAYGYRLDRARAEYAK